MRGHRRRRRAVKWMTCPWNQNTGSLTFAGVTMAQATLLPLSQDVPAAEGVAGAPAIGAFQMELYENAWRLERLVLDMHIGVSCVRDDPTGSPKSARHMLCRFGVFVGETDSQGNLLNALDWDLAQNAAGTDESHSRRWLAFREWMLTNPLGETGLQQIFEGSSGGHGAFSTTGAIGPVGVFEGLRWPQNNIAYPWLGGHHFDLKPRATVGKNQRLFYRLAVGNTDPVAAGTTQGTIVFHFDQRVLASRAWKRSR